MTRPETLTGDNAANDRILRLDNGSFAGNIAPLDTIKDLEQIEVVVSGHGPTGGWEIVDAYRTYLAGVYDSVTELYEEAMSDFEMKPEIEQRLARFKDWSGFQEELGKHISLAYLEVEAKAF